MIGNQFLEVPLNEKHRAELIEMIENGEITTAAEGIEAAKRLREPAMCR